MKSVAVCVEMLEKCVIQCMLFKNNNKRHNSK